MDLSTTRRGLGNQKYSTPALVVVVLFLFFLARHGAANADTLVLVSDNKPAFTNIADAIQNAASNVRIEHMRGDSALADELAAQARQTSIRNVVAIGSLAAQAARRYLDNKAVIFCQVLNPEQFDLITPWMKGVAALPSLERQFSAWRQINPNLRRVGVITGGQMYKLVDEARRAAEKAGIVLIHEVVSSGREIPALIARKRGDIQGLWLAPDSTILSSDILRSIVSSATLNDIQILTFTPALLKEGALLSATAIESEIALLALSRLKRANSDNQIPGDPILYPAEANIQYNYKAADYFRLSVPSERSSHAP